VFFPLVCKWQKKLGKNQGDLLKFERTSWTKTREGGGKKKKQSSIRHRRGPKKKDNVKGTGRAQTLFHGYGDRCFGKKEEECSTQENEHVEGKKKTGHGD